jgi:hypothetical protein
MSHPPRSGFIDLSVVCCDFLPEMAPKLLEASHSPVSSAKRMTVARLRRARRAASGVCTGPPSSGIPIRWKPAAEGPSRIVAFISPRTPRIACSGVSSLKAIRRRIRGP